LPNQQQDNYEKRNFLSSVPQMLSGEYQSMIHSGLISVVTKKNNQLKGFNEIILPPINSCSNVPKSSSAVIMQQYN
jgi:hypothetical protein